MISNQAENKQKNIIALRDFLWEIASEPSKFSQDEAISKALTSQGNLAKYENAGKAISASSLNTLKRHSEKWLAGGYASLEDARCSAKENIEDFNQRKKSSTKRTKKALQEKIVRLDNQDKQTSKDNLLLAGALRMALMHMREYASSSNDASIISRSEQDRNEILQLFSLARHPIVTNEGE
ncbi:hypothetical protein [Massilia varians]|jgi:hypothetical protein|uniref:hypothetical protein n=1 Tax=Massilia varians TaxID=457921 RepID=UPI0025544C0D|nr:hypothetical protein [Massilia varians]MDK6078530.1 hypothetical protein [Massilia varians]